MNRKKGLFVTIEGLDGAGKTLLIEQIEKRLKEWNLPYVRTKEPGGTEIAEQIREILLNPENKIHMNTEIMLYATSRSSHVHDLILPALSEGKIVICDRFIDSSIAYQGYGAGHSQKQIEVIKKINEYASGYIEPDRTYFIDIPVAESFARMGLRSKKNNQQLDRIEQRSKAFYQRVYEGFQEIARRNPKRVVKIDGLLKPDEVFEKTWEDLIKIIQTQWG
jgi:dTMP kinase